MRESATARVPNASNYIASVSPRAVSVVPHAAALTVSTQWRLKLRLPQPRPTSPRGTLRHSPRNYRGFSTAKDAHVSDQVAVKATVSASSSVSSAPNGASVLGVRIVISQL